MIVWLLYLTVVVYNLLDVYQTKLLFQFNMQEGNPVVAYFIDQFSSADPMSVIIGVKSVPLLLLLVLLILHQRSKDGRENEESE